jgi:ubiquinone/menaquinone biosynthesis C-methylase UbiE
VDLHNLALDRAELAGDEAVLDVGCGNGAYLATLARREHRGFVTGLDMSAGMLDAAQTHSSVPLMIGDAQALPVRDASFDVVLAMHMLYHAPDRALAISELRRVMRDRGVTLVVTNSDTHLQQINEIVVPRRVLPSLTFRSRTARQSGRELSDRRTPRHAERAS